MNKKMKPNYLEKFDNKKEEIIQNNLGKITISNSVKKNNENRKKVIDEELKKTVAIYNQEYSILNDAGIELFYIRKKTLDLIEHVEYLINSIANHPKKFDKEISDINIIKENFKQTCDFAKEELETTQKSALTAGVGITGGLAIGNLAPSAAMWVATTFGTASTGTAISTLSGAAATNAALAWLGGGSLTAGGAGMSGGNALLALAGPIGWSIAGVTLLASILLFSKNKGKINKEKRDEIKKIKVNIQRIVETSQKIKILLEENKSLYNSIINNYKKALYVFNKDYNKISGNDKLLLGSLINETRAISKSIEKGI